MTKLEQYVKVGTNIFEGSRVIRTEKVMSKEIFRKARTFLFDNRNPSCVTYVVSAETFKHKKEGEDEEKIKGYLYPCLYVRDCSRTVEIHDWGENRQQIQRKIDNFRKALDAFEKDVHAATDKLEKNTDNWEVN